MAKTNLFLTKGANVSEMVKALPKNTVETGFVINEVDKVIEYHGNPKALKFVVPVMKSVVNSLDASAGFTVIETPKTYLDKSGNIKTTNVVTFGYTDVATARILCENVNKLVKAQYEEYKKTKK